MSLTGEYLDVIDVVGRDLPGDGSKKAVHSVRMPALHDDAAVTTSFLHGLVRMLGSKL
jgi:hypothetical protein